MRRALVFLGVASACAPACVQKEESTAQIAPPPIGSVRPPPPLDTGIDAAVDVPWETLVDLDRPSPRAAVTAPETFAKLASEHFAHYRTTRKACAGAGDAELAVDGGVEGAFTKIGAKEKLYLVNVYPCSAKIAPTHTLLVIDGDRVVLRTKVPESRVAEVRDVDQDGDNEIVLAGVFDGETSARLVDTEDGQFETLFDFHVVARGSCEGGKPIGDSALIEFRKVDTSMQYRSQPQPKVCPTK